MMDLNLLHISVWANFAAFFLITFLPKNRVKLPPAVALLFSGAGAAASAVLLVRRFGGEMLEWKFPWLTWNSAQVNLGYYLDDLSLVMLTSVCLISFLIQLYSVWYMNEDADKKRFFATITFFTWAMISFVVSVNLFASYLFWELIGLASYLLIGFWHERPAPRRAAIKAFVMTRFGDLGFLAAVILLISHVHNLDIPFLNSQAAALLGPGELLLVIVLLFFGVMGKSAQFPLHTWLPDAMEGPTPVSALIHSATMVAAGVYLLVRLFPMIEVSQGGMHYILFIGAFTSVLAACLALTECDMKRILAYSTVSQLGFMVMAVGSGTWHGGMFHLITHAFFKSMLFLLSGYFIFVAHHSNSIFDMAALPLKEKSKWMLVLLWIGALALSGLFPFSGFMSKESIFGYLLETRQYPVYGIALFISFLTAYYTTRMAFIVSKNGSGPGAGDKRDSPLRGQSLELRVALNLPVTVLGILTVAGVWVFLPWHKEFFHIHTDWHAREWMNLGVTSALVLAGIGTSFFYFGRKSFSEKGWPALIPGLDFLISKKFFMDDFWNAVMEKIVKGFSRLSVWSDAHIINAAVNHVGLACVRSGRAVAELQAGEVQRYILVALLVIVSIIFYLLTR
ncbi:MAG: NADH-quinone oxidoreductase subunit L [Candidatus Omnitrophica bacterium]|nr:NADH-quinone oxidoreductase subunit L [Candidatus Omnitrophota bacterium]